MKCRRVQMLIVAAGALSGEAMAHANACPACQRFLRDVAALESATTSLEAAPPGYLQDRIRDRIANPQGQFGWRAVAVSAAIAVILTGPMIQLVSRRYASQYVKGERIGTLPPFHVKFYGKSHMGLNVDAASEMWFSGFALRNTMDRLDLISDFEQGVCYQRWKPDGVPEKRAEKWAGTGKPVTHAEFVQILNRVGPAAPDFGVKTDQKRSVLVRVFGHPYQTDATTYRLPVTKRGSLTSVETPTNQIVYQDRETGRIVRIEIVATFPGGITQTETHDYEYVIPSDDKFEESTLAATPTKVPMMAPAKGR